MLLSIVIPVYNVEKYIIRCLESILAQNVDKDLYEIIIIDDETPDDSIKIASEYCKKHNNIKFFYQKNKGLGGARNSGILYSTGDYIWFVDSDDTVALNSIENIFCSIKTNNDIYIFDVSAISINSKEDSKMHSNTIESIEGYLLTNYFVPTQVWRNVYKREFIIRKKLFFKEHFLHEDGEFNMRAITLADLVSYCPFIIYNYYLTNNNSIMHNIKLKNQLDLLSYFHTADELIQSKNIRVEQLACINKYLKIMLGLVFKNAINLNTNEFIEFRKVLNTFRKKIIKLQNTSELYNSFKVISMLIITNKWYYNLIFNKSITIKK